MSFVRMIDSLLEHYTITSLLFDQGGVVMFSVAIVLYMASLCIYTSKFISVEIL